MITIADINVLLPILVADHAFHPVAWDWWETRTDASVGLCLLSRLGVLRLLCNSKVMAGSPVTPLDALRALDSLAEDPRCIWVESDAGHELFFRRFVGDRQVSPNLWTDAWLAALAASNGFRLTSFDKDFRAFSPLDFELLGT